ncbi:acyl-[acyl-carrier-protein]--UDP-N-acetylglucosamine O-acyltransferase [Planctomycetia bacterium]|nr:acyl-[acyl-carrier-protein]--UDP-N-acetylglucosamine O-acyltransferase [Planctomycetia bacterium]
MDAAGRHEEEGGLTLPIGREPTLIHPTAIVEPGAVLGAGVRIGPSCVVSAQSVIGRGTVLANNVTLLGSVRIGERNRIFPNCVIGGEPQDVSYRGTVTRVEIGDDNVIREGVTINRASEKEEGLTAIGSYNYLMANCHVAHDCRIGDHVIIANGTLLGGHVRIQSRASLSGAVAVHHWATIGGWAFVAGLTRVLHDVPPFMLVEGSPARPRCVNLVALKRGDFHDDTKDAIVEAHRLLYRAKVGCEAAREVLRQRQMLVPEVMHLLDFLVLQQEGRHGRARERRRAA